MKKKYKFLPHTSDVKFKIYGKSINELFENAIEAFSIIVAREKKVGSVKKKKIEIEGEDYEEILYKLFDELIYLIDAKGFLVSAGKINVENKKSQSQQAEGYFLSLKLGTANRSKRRGIPSCLSNKKIKGIIYGDDSSKYSGLESIKAATYAEMYVREKNKKWEAQAVLDV